MKNIVIVIAFVATICLGAVYGSVLADDVDTISDRDNPNSDLYILAHVICGEAQNCDELEQEYVASVVINRKNSDLFPNTLAEVVFQDNPLQYACTQDGNYYKEPTETNWEVAQRILYNGSVLPADVVYQSAVPLGSYIYEHTTYHYYCGV